MGTIHTVTTLTCFLAVGGIIFTTVYKEWKRNSVRDSQPSLNHIYRCDGLWVRCTSSRVGQYQCDSYGTANIALPAYLTALRAMMIISCMLSASSFAMSVASLDCNSTLPSKQKKRTRRAAGFMLMIAGILTLASVSWYAAKVIREFKKDHVTSHDSFKYELGASLYVGWMSSILALISGGVMAWSAGSDDDDHQSYRYNNGKTAGSRSTEYV